MIDMQEEALIKINPIDVTVLFGAQAELHGNLEPSPEQDETQGERADLWTEGWNSLDDYFAWTVEVPKAGDYRVTIVYSCASGSNGSEYEIVVGDSKVTGTVHETGGWLPGWGVDWTSFEKEPLDGTLHLPKGVSTIELCATKKPESGQVMRLYTLELTPLATRDTIAAAGERAKKMRASTDWFVAAKYGVTFHWTVETQPRRGQKQPFPDAVRDFDVSAFADMVEGTGAGYVIFTSTHAPHWFPAPIQTIERILPGNTCERDLIGDMADALDGRGIKLILYYPGGRSMDDTPTIKWGQASGWKDDKARYLHNFCDIFAEIGQRYGDKIAGYWFDFCPFNVSHHFERLYRAAKTGNPDRIIAWNSWINRKPTDFQEYWAGEMGADLVQPEPDHFKDLQPHVWIVVDDDDEWVHSQPNTDIGPPNFDTRDLIDYVKACVAKEIVVSMNLSIYQDGTISPATFEQMQALRKALRGR
jgi:hypothetical protein